MVEIRNLRKTFGPTVAVDDVSFDVAKGEVLGFLGPNGAGKTTTMRVLTCYIPADSGTARVAGFDTYAESIEVRRRIGYLPESAPLYLDMGVMEYLSFVASIRGLPKSMRERRIADMVELCNLGSVRHKTVGELSKGFRQRVGLAQTLIHDPDVLILDEPTTGLDPNQIVQIRELIRRIGREKTVLLSTHILQEVEATCSRVQIIDNGRLVAQGTTEELTRFAVGERRVVVRYRAAAGDVEPRLRELGGVSGINALDSEEPGTCRYEVIADETDGLEERLFRLAVESGWVLTELRPETRSLEQVFQSLTRGEVV
ncbi:MAG: ATP-binding cassette domain-containing protein [Candidatus Eisenbacteria bacterium]|nr:ATP-binding cassette domain-containing protein [Candidatus Latescibacterota bacterium]MBD3303144.1 ATP-binding cassette domain-containing protein [Candidatus Eisenbacteria bacterium]